jgi:hypothetical protein
MLPVILLLSLLLQSTMLSVAAAAALASDSVNAGYAYYEQGSNTGDSTPGGEDAAPAPARDSREIVTIAAVLGGVLVSIVWFVWWRVARDRAKGRGKAVATTTVTSTAESDDAGGGASADDTTTAAASATHAAGGGGGGGSYGDLGEERGEREVYGNTTTITAGFNPFRDPPDCDKPLPQDKPLPSKIKEDGEMATIAAVRPDASENWVGPVISPRSHGGT